MISVVIPTHNRCDLLPRAIKSVQNQTYGDVEIIIVSDGSTDETKSVVEDIMSRDRRVHFIEYYPARGGNTARNTGIDAAKGRYIAFLDDDDEWMPEKLEKQVQVMESNDEIGLVYTGVQIIYVNEKVSYKSKARNEGNLSQSILLDNHIGTTSTVMLKRTVLEQTGGFDEKLRALQDYDLWIRVCQHCKVGVVPEEMIKYYNYTGSTQVSALTQKYIDSFAYINNKYEDLFTGLSDAQMKKKRINECMLLLNKCLRNNNGRLARKYAKESLKEGNKKAIVFWMMSFFSYRTVLKVRSMI